MARITCCCRCLHLHKAGESCAIRKWNSKYRNFDSRLLCELASVSAIVAFVTGLTEQLCHKASYHFDIQPLVDQTCRSIAQVMSASDTAHELRETFGLDDCSDGECNCGKLNARLI